MTEDIEEEFQYDQNNYELEVDDEDVPQLPTNKEQSQKNVEEGADVLDLGEAYSEEEEDEEAIVEAARNAQQKGKPNDDAGQLPPHVIAAQQQPRLFSQQNQRTNYTMGEGYGRPLTKHVPARPRVQTSVPVKGRVRSKNAGNSGIQTHKRTQLVAGSMNNPVTQSDLAGYPSSFSAQQFYPQGQNANGYMADPQNYVLQQSNGAVLPGGAYANNNPQFNNTQQEVAAHYQVPIKPMYGRAGNVTTPASANPNRRQVIQQIIHNNGSGNILFSSGGNVAGQSSKKRPVPAGNVPIATQKAYQAQQFKQIESEEVKNNHRNLKIQHNIVKDENTRLRTRMQAMQIEMSKREQDVNLLTKQLQGTFLPQNSNQGGAQGIQGSAVHKTNYMESFLVQQLKKQNRQLKAEISERECSIEELRKNVKLSRAKEADSEVQAYADECLRLRTLLEQTLIQNDALHSQQNNLAAHEEAVNVHGVRIQEAINAHEEQLASEHEQKNNLEIQILNQKERENQLLSKLKDFQRQARRYQQAANEAKRKHNIIGDKNKQIDYLRAELQDYKIKAGKLGTVYSQNRDLVTRKCALESAVSFNDKKVQSLEDRVRELEEICQTQEKAAVAPKYHPAPVSVKPTKAKARMSPVKIVNKHKEVMNPNNLSPVMADERVNPLRMSQQNNSDLKNSGGPFEVATDEDLKLKNEGISDGSRGAPKRPSDTYANPRRVSAGMRTLDSAKKANQAIVDEDDDDEEEQYDLDGYDDDEGAETPLNPDEKPRGGGLTRVPGSSHIQKLGDGRSSKKDDSDSDDDGKFGGDLDDLKEQAKSPESNTKGGMLKDIKSLGGSDSEDDYNEEPLAASPVKDGEASSEPRENENEEYGEDENEYGEEQQIAEEDMLDIAEQIFNLIVQCLTQQGITVRDAFGGEDMIHVLENFEGQKDVKVMTADDFLTRCQEIGVPKLDNVQVQCILRVLGKQQLSNAIKLDELEILMSNFTNNQQQQQEEESPEVEADTRPKSHKSDGAKGKSKKKKQISELLDQNPTSEQELSKIFKEGKQFDDFVEEIQKSTYIQQIKSKRGTSDMAVIKKEDFLEICTGLSEQTIEIIEPLLYLNVKFSDIYQVKHLFSLFKETSIRADLGDQIKQEEGGQKITFKQLESDEENDD